ncbi:MAG: SpoIIE family protein phosphatase [Bacteroidales bacterium]|nr:SpoIIE family protein phosphatase [Bacteroidales bacterium]
MKYLSFKRWRKSLKTKSALAIIVTVGVLIETTSIIQYKFAYDGIREEVQHRAESELKLRSFEIRNVMNAVEVAVTNMAWAVEQNLSQPDSMYAITQRIIECNSIIIGSAVAFEPNYYPQKGRLFSPYSYKQSDNIVRSKQLGTDTYNYHDMEWYTEPMRKGQPHWSEPYFDEGGGEMMMSTYSIPIHDANGRAVAIFTADVSLDWLGAIINTNKLYPSSFNMMVSRTGQMMTCPIESLVMRKNINDLAAEIKDTTAALINQRMMAGESGMASVTDENGELNHVFYAPVDNHTGWSMAIVCSDREIYYGLRQVSFNLFILMIIGMLLLGYIIMRTARSAQRLQMVNAEKERIGSELHIASEIQKGMLPKIFPPYPDRNDIDIFGSLVPAKEVGGDLFDFYIRDEKLFFCIGDVSGKGVPASLVMAVTRAQFRTMSAHESSPDRIITAMNEAMSEMNEANMFVTFFIGVLDLPTGRMRFCNAGHNAPLLIGSGVGTLKCNSNIPLGIMQGWKFNMQETLIDCGTTIFLYTDGLTEAEDSEHAQFEESRMMVVAQKALADGTHNPTNLINNMVEAVHSFVGNADQSDDLTMLAVQYTKPQKDEKFQRSLTLTNNVQDVPQLAAFVEGVCEETGFDASTAMQINLALEEAVVNIMNYAYPQGTFGNINIKAQANDVRLKFIITDSGSPFDPTVKEDADITLSAAERPIGGLGIFLVRQLMDSINYERIDGQNILTLRKKLPNIN